MRLRRVQHHSNRYPSSLLASRSSRMSRLGCRCFLTHSRLLLAHRDRHQRLSSSSSNNNRRLLSNVPPHSLGLSPTSWSRLRTSSRKVRKHLSSLASRYQSFPPAAAVRMSNLDQVHKMLEGGYANVPQPQDTEKYATQISDTGGG